MNYCYYFHNFLNNLGFFGFSAFLLYLKKSLHDCSIFINSSTRKKLWGKIVEKRNIFISQTIFICDFSLLIQYFTLLCCDFVELKFHLEIMKIKYYNPTNCKQ